LITPRIIAEQPPVTSIAVAPISTGPAVLNEKLLNDLAEMLLETDFNELIELWLKSLTERTAAVPALAAAGDFAGLRVIAHDFIGTGGSFGAVRLADTAGRLGDACRRGDAKSVEAIAAELVGDASVTVKAVRDLHWRSGA
jgi:hypothetical protein